ncbi:MAG: 4Fe-4S binding protein [Phycisphaerae bacterium]|nr:4Fe-4S binding protein [Phycisphaerae bacterium]
MPWVDQERCTGCATCVEECPTGAIALEAGDVAAIDDQTCIRCGTCHETCPEEAVRHDGERLLQKVAANLEWTEQLLKHYKTPSAQAAFIGRITKYFTLQRKVAEQTIERLKAIETDAPRMLRSAIEALQAGEKGGASPE